MDEVALGYTIFYVDDVAATLRFFTTAFGLAERFVTSRFVVVTHAHLGVVSDRHQNVVELMGRRSD